MQAYIHIKEQRADGSYDCYHTQEVECKETETPRFFSASGYGSKIPTAYMVRFNGRWRRVYAVCYSNAATLYIGKKYTPCLTVDIYR